MSVFARLFGDLYKHIKGDIFKFAQAMNFSPTHQQEQLFGCVQRGDPQIAVKSGQGPGKTAATVIVALWRSLQAENAQTILTAPTMRQCRDVWLAEARRIMPRADGMLQRLIKVTQTRIVIAENPDWGVKTVTATKEENAQGAHEPNQTIICEEASGISRGIVEQFKGTSSNPNSLLLMIGNPNTRDCAFFDCFNSQSKLWACITWNAEETPKSEFFDPVRNWKLAMEFGRDSDVYRIRVLGEFPRTDPNCVISQEDLFRCIDIKLMVPASMQKVNDLHPKQFGLDFARFGGDESTVYRRSGNAIVEFMPPLSHAEPSEAVKHAFWMQRNAGWANHVCHFVADAGGIGQGIMHLFYEKDKQLLEFHNGGTAVETTKYDNLITEGWFGLAHKIKRTEPTYIPNDPILLQQLGNRRYYTTKMGKLIIESKDEYMDRGHDSPDRADGVVMAMYDNVMARSRISAAREAKKLVGKDSIAVK